MEITVPYVQVKQKYQITIPAVLRNQLDIHEGDTLEASIEDGHIIFTPKELVTKVSTKQDQSNLTSYIGSGKGLFSSPEEADNFIRNERNLWES